jgi:hypothetical protein
MLYIVRFKPYRPHGFVPGDASPLLSLAPQNTYNMLATGTTNKASYQTLIHRCGILQILSVYIDQITDGIISVDNYHHNVPTELFHQ